jgi:hypothetical protein
MAIPEELAALEQWVCYNRNKEPRDPRENEAASSTDPTTWTTLSFCSMMVRGYGYAGVGFVFSKDDPFVGIDLDHCFDEDGGLLPWADKLVKAFNSYTEVSPSGNGLHIIVRGEQGRGRKDKVDDKHGGGAIECYSDSRYFCTTGNHYGDTPTTIEEAPEALASLRQWFDRKRKTTATKDYDDSAFEDLQAEEWVPGALSWSASCPEKYDGPHKTAQKWSRFNGDSHTLRTIAYLAMQRGWTPPQRMREINLSPDFRAKMEAFLARHGIGTQPPEPDEPWFFDLTDLYQDDTPLEPYMIEPQVLGEGDTMLIAGPPKSMKSLLVLDMVRQWAQGQPWQGMTPRKPLNVALIQFELKRRAMRERIQSAELDADELAALKARVFISRRIRSPQLGRPDWVKAISDGILEAMPAAPDLVIIDPLANIFDGESENDTTKMVEFLQRLRAFASILNPLSGLVIVHHANKSTRDVRSAEPFNAIRGSSALRGFYDAGVYVEKEGDRVRAVFELRNGPAVPEKGLYFHAGRFVDADQKDKDEILVTLMKEAQRHIVSTREQFMERYAANFSTGEKKLGGLLSSLLEAGTVYRWMPTDQICELFNVEKLSKRSKGYLGVKGMVLGMGEYAMPIPPKM